MTAKNRPFTPGQPSANRKWPPGTPCRRCTTTEGARTNSTVPFRADGSRWGYAGALCQSCYEHHRQLDRRARGKARQAAALLAPSPEPVRETGPPWFYAPVSRAAIQDYRRATRKRGGA